LFNRRRLTVPVGLEVGDLSIRSRHVPPERLITR
jgi:hypothetical protein